MESSITDHECVAFNLCLRSPISSAKCIKKINRETLEQELLSIDFSPIYSMSDVDIATKYFIDKLKTAITNNSKTVFISKRKRIKSPWMTQGLLRCLRNRDNIHKKLKQDPTSEILRSTYKRYRNFCSKIIKSAKREHEKKQIDKAGNNSKNIWKAVRNVVFSPKSRDPSAELIRPESPNYSVNTANSYFAEIGQKLAEEIILKYGYPSFPTSNSKNINSFGLLSTDIDEVTRIVMSLRDDCAVGIDMIPAWVLKSYHYILVPSINYICNLAFHTGSFPNLLKISLIKPVYKSGNESCISNYRPISILPALSKVLEKIINKRLVSFFETNDILSPLQYGFRTGKSTADAVLKLTDLVVEGMDTKMKTIAIFLDLAKAFDTVSVPLLLSKLEDSGVRGTPLKLLSSYLSNRKQRVKINDVISSELPMSYGVPQGSILGPTLFLIYINGLCELQLTNGKIIAFADDTVLLFRDHSWKDVMARAQDGFSTVCQWLRNNILTLNVTKTNYMTFAIQKKSLPNNIAIRAHCCNDVNRCSCPTLERVECVKYLGVYVDSCLTFKFHIDTLVSRLRKLIFIFKTLRHIAQPKIVKIFYFALCQSLISYCITSWGGASKTHLLIVERAQRAILKTSAFLPFRHPTSELYHIWDVLTVRKLFILNSLIRKHTELPYDPNLNKDKRRKGKVCELKSTRTSWAQKYYYFSGDMIYNKVNSILSIYHLPKHKYKMTISNWLKSLTYDETEKLISPLP